MTWDVCDKCQRRIDGIFCGCETIKTGNIDKYLNEMETRMRITTTSDIEHNKVKMIVYGESGAGKTSLAKTIKEKVLIISSEAGLLCLQDAQPAIDVIDISQDNNGGIVPKEMRIDKMIEVYQFLTTQDTIEKYDWVFIDSLTEISQNLVEALNVEYPDRKDSLVLYGENSKKMRAMIKAFRDLPYYNIVFTALPSIEKDDLGRRYTSISMVGRIAQTLPSYFDEVLYLDAKQDAETGEIKRYLMTQKTSDLVCKDRSGKLDKYEPADLDVIINKIRGKNNE